MIITRNARNKVDWHPLMLGDTVCVPDLRAVNNEVS